MKELKYEDYEERIKEKKYEEIFAELAKKAYELAQEIGKIKNMDIKENPNSHFPKYYESFTSIEIFFDKNFGVFRGIFCLMRNASNLYDDDDYFANTEEKKIEYFINSYNPVINELECYRKTEEEIKNRGFEEVLEERIKKVKNLYLEMLKYKNKEIDKSWDLRELTRKVVHYYNFCQEDIYNTEWALYGGFASFDVEKDDVVLNEVERIMFADDLLNYLTPTEKYGGYEAYADVYKDYELKEGQTYSDLYDEKEEILVKLLREMLEFVGVEVTESDKYLGDLRYKVAKHYPFYEGSLSLLRFSNPNETYISKFDTMDKVYERLSSDYKNYEKNMEEYKKNNK
ncbi:MAG: hypothetical protein IKL55_06235 [Clostridia bacterium]|nr:hypothetical protein [Clostridia bacterium]